MRKIIVLAVLVFSVCAVANAQQTQPRSDFFIFVDNAEFSWVEGQGTNGSAGYGLSFRHFVTPKVSAELSIARHDRTVVAYEFGDPVPIRFSYRARVMPADLIVSYNYVNDTRWKPYIGGGVHYSFVSNVPYRSSRLGAEVVGGVAFNVTPRFYIRADAKGLLNNNTVYENNFRSLFGVGWRF